MSLSFRDHRFEPTGHPGRGGKDKDMTYAARLFVTAEFVNKYHRRDQDYRR
jgi:DNA-directed RNA polymerase subunit beta